MIKEKKIKFTTCQDFYGVLMSSLLISDTEIVNKLNWKKRQGIVILFYIFK